MRKLALLGVALFSFAAAAIGIQLDQSKTYTFTDCSSGGSSAQAIPEGTYLLTVTDESTWLCTADSASTCATLGTKYGAPFGMLLTVGRGGKSASCRSTGSTGDLQLTRTLNE